MKILIVENISLRLKIERNNHEVKSVKSMGWLETKNGELLKLVIQNEVEVLISLDKNMAIKINDLNSLIKETVFNPSFFENVTSKLNDNEWMTAEEEKKEICKFWLV